MRLANGFGSISKLSGKRRRPYIVRKTTDINENGVQQYKILGYFAKKTEALEFLILYNKNEGIVDFDMSLQDVYKAFVEYKFTKNNKKIPSTYNSPYKRLESLWNIPFAKVKLMDLEPIMDAAPSPATKRDLKSLLTQMYKYAIKHEITDRNIAESLDSPDMVKSKKHKAFTEKELKLLWRKKDEEAAKLWLIYIYTGLRPSELILIKNENVHLDEKYMIGGIKTEAGTDRDIPLAECIIPFIKEYYNPNKEYLILHNGHPLNYNNLADVLNDFCTTYGLEHTPHDARHTCATMLDGADIPITTIQFILGHVGTSVTDKVYIHKQLPKMLKAVNTLPVYAS